MGWAWVAWAWAWVAWVAWAWVAAAVEAVVMVWVLAPVVVSEALDSVLEALEALAVLVASRPVDAAEDPWEAAVSFAHVVSAVLLRAMLAQKVRKNRLVKLPLS